MWKTVKLGDVIEKTETVNPAAKFPSESFEYIDVSSVSKERLEIEETQTLLGKDAPSRARRRVHKDDVIFATVRPTLKRVAVVPKELDGQICSTGYIVLRGKRDVLLPRYLFHWMSSRFVMDYVASVQTGASYPAVTDKQVKEIDIHLPPLAEQQRIVAKLDAAFAEIDRAVDATKYGAENLHKTLVQHLHHCFNFSEEKSYRYVGDVAEHCLGKMLDKKKNKGEMKPYLRNLNVRWFYVTTDDLLEMKFESHEHERYSVRKGDLLICEGGYPGRAAIWNGDDEIYIQKAIHRVRFPNPIQNDWLMYYLYYLDVTDKLKRYFTGSGIQHFTGKALAKLPFPSMEDDVIGEKLQTISAMQRNIEEASRIYGQKVAALESLKSSILAEELQPPEAA